MNKDRSYSITLESFTFFCFTGIIFVIDLVMPLGVVSSNLYILPVCASLFLSKEEKHIKTTTILSLLLIIVAVILSTEKLTLVLITSRLISILLVISTYLLCASYRSQYHLKVKSEEKLKISNDELEKFAYIASHDLKAPIRGIGNVASFLEDDLEDFFNTDNEYVPTIKKNITRIRQQVTKMQNLIKGILEYSKVNSSNKELEEFNLKKLVNQIIKEESETSPFKYSLKIDSIQLVTQKVKLTQVISNLINNAVKYHDNIDKGLIEVRSRLLSNKVEISIKDDGPGIETRFHDKIFEMFQTLDPKDNIESTGVGLAIVKKIVNSKGGQINIESKIGRGTNFIFTWPINENLH